MGNPLFDKIREDLMRSDIPGKAELLEQLDKKERELGEDAKPGDVVEALMPFIFQIADNGGPHGETELDPEEVENADRVAKQIQEFFDEQKWHYTTRPWDEDHDLVFRLTFTIQKVRLQCMVVVETRPQAVRINVTLPTCLSPYEPLIDHYIVKRNYSLRFGAFHRDESDNEVCYRYSFSFRDGHFDTEVFDQYLDACLLTSARARDDISRLCHGKLTREQREQAYEIMDKLKADLDES